LGALHSLVRPVVLCVGVLGERPLLCMWGGLGGIFWAPCVYWCVCSHYMCGGLG